MLLATIGNVANGKAGEYLAQLERADHNRGNQYVPMSNVGHSQNEYSSTLEESGISRQDANGKGALGNTFMTHVNT